MPSTPSISISSVMSGGKFSCRFVGCDKSFTRKEHLVRHAQAHDSSTQHVCKVCGREFTRRDSLQRHLLIHGESYKPSPSGRSRRACGICHLSKTKCDGNQRCLKCIKKGVECVYDQSISDPQVLVSGTNAGRDGKNCLLPVKLVSEELPNPSNDQVSPLVFHDQVNRPTSTTVMSAAEFPMYPPPTINDLGPRKTPTEWALETRIQPDPLPPGPHSKSRIHDDNPYPLSKPSIDKYIELYFSHFHHRWPIIHSATYDFDGPNIEISSMYMIGGWLQGTRESKEFAITVFGKLTDQILQQLNQFSSDDVFNQSLPLILCKAALLNIVFGLYCGRENLLSKGIILRNTLVGVLREVGFFMPEIPWDKPVVFVPFRMVTNEGRKRLVANLFKIDSYLSFLRLQPGLLTPEDLHLPLPATFSLYNFDGLHIFQARMSIEPPARASKTIRDILQEVSPDFSTPRDGLMLLEDIQLGLCGMQFSIWQIAENIRQNTDTNYDIKRNTLIRQLESWHRLLLRLPFRHSDQMNRSQDQHMAMRFYYGIENHAETGWQLAVFARPKGLYFDAIMLYHLLSLQLYADIRIFRQHARDLSSRDLLRIYGKPYEQDRFRREKATQEWSSTHYARRALYHAASTFVTYHNLSQLENKTVDPIAYMTLSVSALVIWTYCTFSHHYCERCPPDKSLKVVWENVPVVELTKWSESHDKNVCQSELDMWIKIGGGRPSLSGTQLCHCNGDILMQRFRSCLPADWNLFGFS